jgi:CubicO group peptidase (beta-lactamase class C family)
VLDTGFQEVCEAAAAEWSVPALAVGVDVGDGASVVAFGCAADTRFRIASITKPMTALLALQLLDPEAVTGVWPDDVRVRHLLSHTSGFDCEFPERDLARFGDGEDALARCVAELPSVHRFLGVEEVWSYANSGFWLAGHLAAVKAGCTYEEALERHVLAPAGLAATSFAEPDLAGTGADVLEGPYPVARRPAGGLTSSVVDVLRFGRVLLTDPRAARMRVVHGKPNAGVYGLGLFGERVAGIDVWGHSGSYGGFQSSLLLAPDRDAVFVGLTNAGNGGRALRRIEDEFFERVTGGRRRVRPTTPLSVEARGRFAGRYENADERYDVTVAEDGLLLSAEGEQATARPVAETVFEVLDGDARVMRLDFPLDGFGRFGSRLAERVG